MFFILCSFLVAAIGRAVASALSAVIKNSWIVFLCLPCRSLDEGGSLWFRGDDVNLGNIQSKLALRSPALQAYRYLSKGPSRMKGVAK